jgi:hypothetical protein
MSKNNPFSFTSLAELPARATKPSSTINVSSASVVQSHIKEVIPVSHQAVSPKPSPKSSRTTICTRLDPDLYDAVNIELKRQKRSKKRASGTLPDLFDELLRRWLNENGVSF